ncbi:unnamed protein product [Ceratitis capitata]|uniref:(Mediterranean fruit fly) hypothetical protein n=1 Tax=Ceratitis capitata TaxID=7213 RepID=A0A811UVV1_CERCA|nr:unnamed protein product [Ceratitis capitata]
MPKERMEEIAVCPLSYEDSDDDRKDNMDEYTKICEYEHYAQVSRAYHRNALKQTLEKIVRDMTALERECQIVFDEVAIKRDLTSNKTQDVIDGFVDNGQGVELIWVLILVSQHMRCNILLRGGCQFTFCVESFSKTGSNCEEDDDINLDWTVAQDDEEGINLEQNTVENVDVPDVHFANV